MHALERPRRIYEKANLRICTMHAGNTRKQQLPLGTVIQNRLRRIDYHPAKVYARLLFEKEKNLFEASTI